MSDSLTSYLQQIGKMPPLQPAEQTRLGNEIDEAAGRLRALLCRIGFVAEEYLRLIDDSLNAHAAPAD